MNELRELELTRRFLRELLFVYNEGHPQQALRRRIVAALASDWKAALIIPEQVVDWNAYATLGEEDNGERSDAEEKHTGLLSKDASPSPEGTAPWDRN